MQEIHRKYVSRWLSVIIVMIIAMVMLGGITRLTQSGLSMTTWQFTGSLPPLTEKEWQLEFEHYKTSPEYKLVNTKFELSDFKNIFWWEYTHRALGRLIGITFLIPFLFFLLSRKMSWAVALKCLLAFLLIISQGLLGWIMVKSGLNKAPHVSHFLLAAHLCLAIFTLIYIFYIQRSISNSITVVVPMKIVYITRILFLSLVFQIILGALVAGLKAGHIYNTFPKMGDHWVPPELFSERNLLFSGAALQFIHRSTAFVIFILVTTLLFYSRKNKHPLHIWRSINLTFYLLLLQIFLGIICIVYSVPVVVGVAHQICAVLLVVTVAQFLLQIKRKSSQFH